MIELAVKSFGGGCCRRLVMRGVPVWSFKNCSIGEAKMIVSMRKGHRFLVRCMGSETNIAVQPARPVSAEFLLMPAARHLAQSMKLDVSSVCGSGRGGRILKEDILRAIASRCDVTVPLPPTIPPPIHSSVSSMEVLVGSHANEAAQDLHVKSSPPTTQASAPPTIQQSEESRDGAFEDITNNNIRKVTAKRLTESKATVPHLYSTVSCEVDALLSMRKTLADAGTKVSVNDVIIKCVALALRDVPEAAAQWDEKTGTSRRVSDTIDVSVAVATPSGLITPIIPKADQLGLGQISATIRDLATRAKDNKLQLHEFQGGTFTVSNLGMFGITEFSAVINSPQACILAVGGAVPSILPALGKDGERKLRKANVMNVKLSCDRRVVDEAVTGQFLSVFKHYIEDPKLIML